jgi:hypothetical protein
VPQTRQRAEFGAESFDGGGIGQSGAKNLDRNLAPGLVTVAREMDFAHPTAAEAAHDLPPSIDQQAPIPQELAGKVLPFGTTRKAIPSAGDTSVS